MNLPSWLDSLRTAITRPGKALALQETQTAVRPGEGGERAMVGSLHREFAEHPSKGLTPAGLYAILEAAEQGDLSRQHALFADMEEKDAQIASDLGKRKQAAAALEWQIVPPDDANRLEKKAAAQATEVFRSLEVEDLIIDLADGIGHGWVKLEIPWDLDGATRIIQQPRWVDHTWFQTRPDFRDEIRLRNGQLDGEELWPLGWLSHRHKAKSGYLSRLGLHRCLVWPYLFQNHALGDLAELLEILGIPARLGTYPRGATAEEKATLLTAVASLGHRAAGIIPEGMAIEYLEAARAEGTNYQAMLDWCERAKSKAILGGTLTTGTDRGSGAYSLGQVHERGLAELVASDARQYAATIRRDLLWPLAALNFGIDRPERSPRFFLDSSETADYEVLAKTLPVFVDLGARIPAWWLHEKTGIPEAGKSDVVLAKAQSAPALDPSTGEPAPAQPAPDAAGIALRAALRVTAKQREADWPVIQTARLGHAAAATIDRWVGEIRAELDRALDDGQDLDAFAQRLLTLYPDLPDGDLTSLMAEALAAAELAGRYELDTNIGLPRAAANPETAP
jgi:phage gp29-like protein